MKPETAEGGGSPGAPKGGLAPSNTTGGMGIFMRRILMILIFSLLLAAPAHASDIEASQRSALGLEGIEQGAPDEAKDIMGDIVIDGETSFESGISKIAAAAKSMLGGIAADGIRGAAVIMIIVILVSLAGSIYEDGPVPSYVSFAGVIAISAALLANGKALVMLGAATLSSICDFSKMLLPALAAAGAATGAVSSAPAKYAATALFMDILLTAVNSVIMPMVYAYIAVSIASAAVPGDALTSIKKLIKWACTTVLTGLVLVFTTYMSLTGVVTGASDAAVTRLAKTTISTAIPVVGGIVSDAAGTVLAGAAMLRNGIGVFGMLCIICLCLAPFLRLGLNYLVFKAVSGLSSALLDNKMSGLISDIGSAFGIVLGVVGAGAIMLFFSLIASMKAVGL